MLTDSHAALVPHAGGATPDAWMHSLLAVVAVGLLSLVGAVTFVVRRERLDRVLPYVVSVAIGALLGNAFLHLIPEISADGFTTAQALLVLGGIVAFFVMERFIHWHQHGHAEGHAVVAPYAWLNLTGDGLHNFADGIIIASAFMQGTALGVTTTVAVALHEIPQELGDVGILLQGQLSRGRALLLNLLTGLVAIVGAVLALVLGGRVLGFEPVVLAVTAGGFIYIAAADLIPELHRERRPAASLLQVGCLLAGIGLMVVLK
jgi:zinc and cadmium transporter